ncbi:MULTISPECIES: substrate-binding periplasmic protein [Vibrio]|uniref:substrate-binding periplasmic protein n=1 Tax=Vibrio TaxID=662 RepID=UPI002075C13D|nr:MULTISPECIES: ABC transporter substrate-binding protein [Vibrio]USD33547.1 transporter substrate-binding domain-containing protein [Vibrio sp. SCSIO 43186]USD46615.1 transporter substrate-binding domain-containing protein [Vibrio sp. SCSIO 43145]USD70671.1 transporter substrate-binding domain-containing protein [Vibrio sp. SCSIO 43139]USD95590.1 ABC transporter [Vibrio coralliilyticus]
MRNLTLMFFSLILLTSPVRGDVLTLTSLEWPPYAGRNLDAQGASVAVVKAAVEAMGHELNVEFYPWERAVHLAKNQAKYAGYFPEYYFDASDLIFSNPIGTGPLGFVENKANPISWSSLQDLKSVKIGVVRGYVNTEELDSMIASGTLQSEAVTSDNQNLKKVSGQRIPLAVIDSNVLNYLLTSDKSLQAAQDKLQMNSKLLEEKELFIAFGNDETGKKWKAIVDEGLKKIDSKQIMSDYFKK